MNTTSSDLTIEEVVKIEEHKYFLSEKAGYDVGWEHAEQDWREKFSEPEIATPIAEAPRGDQKPKGLGGFFKRLLSRAAV